MYITNTQQLRAAIRAPYAWPGGYPTYLITSDGGALCHKCGRTEYRLISEAIRHDDTTGGWQVIGQDVNWEDSELYCDHCGDRIKSAYAED